MGRATALTFARQAASVDGCDVTVEPAEATVEMVRAASGEMVSLQPYRLNDPAECARLSDLAVSERGRIDVIDARDVTASGTTPRFRPWTMAYAFLIVMAYATLPGPLYGAVATIMAPVSRTTKAPAQPIPSSDSPSSSGSASPYRGLVLLRRRPNTQHAA